MSKYKQGDKFEATVIIYDVDYDEDDIVYYYLRVEEFGIAGDIEGCKNQDDLDAAFDPNYKERVRLARIEKLRKELEELENEGNS